ncbi:MAG: holo-ACP synthase [Firmicutes bacterium]|uniref:Holo-[acyl-carrier-protein] synthase n=1 Tax=Candidatus Scybalomonas excrementavium TaxID=2840943 RepID=A0A9D9N7R7_9FIRM|nr:holo-ACP synthase [Candidatus Scybalomonas excrementavium]
MILGVGTDMIEIIRVEKACQKKKFLERVYTIREQELYRDSPSKLAGNFAVKEAVVKVFGTGFHGIEPREIEVLRDEYGKPYINLYGNAKKKQEQLEITNIQVSITNTKEYAMSFVIGENEKR